MLLRKSATTGARGRKTAGPLLRERPNRFRRWRRTFPCRAVLHQAGSRTTREAVFRQPGQRLELVDDKWLPARIQKCEAALFRRLSWARAAGLPRTGDAPCGVRSARGETPAPWPGAAVRGPPPRPQKDQQHADAVPQDAVGGGWGRTAWGAPAARPDRRDSGWVPEPAEESAQMPPLPVAGWMRIRP